MDPCAAIPLTDTVAPIIERSLRERGFAILKGHGVDTALLGNVYSAWREFFNSQEKTALLFGDHLDGYFPLGSERAKDSAVPDPKEFFHFYPWGRKPKGAEQSTSILFDRLNDLGLSVLEALEDHGRPRAHPSLTESLATASRTSPRMVLRITNYLPITKGVRQPFINAPHEDINLLTLLPAATAGGLEIRRRDGNWIRIEPSPENVLVICGDMLAESSSSVYPATTHRVTTAGSPDAGRLSLSFFVNPRDEILLSPKRTAKQYLIERLEQVGLRSATREAEKIRTPRSHG